MSEIAARKTHIAPMTTKSIDRVRALESQVAQAEQEPLSTRHLIHAGMYARTISIPPGMVMTGTLIKIATTLIVHGDVLMYVDDGTVALSGYNVIAASAGRKQAFVTVSEVHMTMLFASDSTSVDAAEREFTDEIDLLVSRRDGSHDTTTITGE